MLVIDTTLRGDLSELLLGGDKGAAGVCVTVCVRAAHGFLEDCCINLHVVTDREAGSAGCRASPEHKQASNAGSSGACRERRRRLWSDEWSRWQIVQGDVRQERPCDTGSGGPPDSRQRFQSSDS